jgi:hypothetical protein
VDADGNDASAESEAKFQPSLLQKHLGISWCMIRVTLAGSAV